MSFPLSLPLHSIIDDQARKSPSKAAVIFEGQTLSYQALSERSDQLAQAMAARGVRPCMVVGICTERSLDMITLLLAIVKTGATYMPIDAGYPAGRIAHMVADARAPYLVTPRRYAEGLSAVGTGSKVLLVEDLLAEVPARAHAFEKPIHAGALYCIYTSGSTGNPKGVLVSHRAFINHLNWQLATFGFDATDVALQRTSISFDAAAWELWTLLCVGGTVVVLSETAQKTPLAMLMAIVECKVTVAQFVPSLLAVLLDMPFASRLRHVRAFCGGEVLPPSLARKAAGIFEHGLTNLYGPTEATIDASWWHCESGSHAQVVPIGKPISGARIHILDERLAPVEAGATGELYIGGDCVALGYVNQPALTAERFLPDPFSTEGRTMYKTGDLGRWMPSGDIEFLGRLDEQVKVRGYRIELEEVRQALLALPAVRDAVVMAEEVADGSRQLVAYVRLQQPGATTVAAIESQLGARLPAFMIPQLIHLLEQFPLTPNGKVDRARLPALRQARSTTQPGTDTEAAVLRIWQEVLQASRLGVEDNFIAIGGHSLSAMRVAARIHDQFRKHVGLKEIFSLPTVRAFSAHLDKLPVHDSLNLSHYSVQDWHLTFETENNLPGLGQVEILEKPAYTPPYLENITLAFRLRGALDKPALTLAFDRLLQRQEALRTNFTRAAKGGFQRRLLPAASTPCHVHDLSASGQEAGRLLEALILEEARTPFALEDAPLLRYALVTLPDEHALLISAHHIASDGWSMSFLLSDLSEYYNAVVEQREPQLAPLRCQYNDYLDWQRVRLARGLLDSQLSYWSEVLDGIPLTLRLPSGPVRPAVFNFKGGRVGFSLGALSASVDRFCREHQCSAYTLLMSVYFLLLYRYLDEDDIYVRSPIANRGEAEIENVVGYFVHPIVIRQPMPVNLTFLEFVQAVNEGILDASVNHGLPPQILEGIAGIRADDGYGGRFQLHFNHQNFAAGSLSFTGIQEARLPIPMLGVKTDLALTTSRVGDEIAGGFTYYEGAVDQAWVQELATSYVDILQAALDSPAGSCDALMGAEALHPA